MKENKGYSIYTYVEAFLRIARSKDHAYEDPVLYERLVSTLYKRQEVATDIGQLFLLHLPLKQDSQITILEEAAGTGIVAFSLARLGYKVIATDIEVAALNRIKEKNTESLPILPINADINKPLPLEANSVDGVTIVSASRYITNIDSFLSEACRVLKPDGVFIWPLPLIGSMLWKIRTGAKQPTSIDSLGKVLESKGFQVIGKDFISSARRNFRAGVPFYAIPSYLIAKKLGS
jgi:SAM-dependent methyltransferase